MPILAALTSQWHRAYNVLRRLETKSSWSICFLFRWRVDFPPAFTTFKASLFIHTSRSICSFFFFRIGHSVLLREAYKISRCGAASWVRWTRFGFYIFLFFYLAKNETTNLNGTWQKKIKPSVLHRSLFWIFDVFWFSSSASNELAEEARVNVLHALLPTKTTRVVSTWLSLF